MGVIRVHLVAATCGLAISAWYPPDNAVAQQTEDSIGKIQLVTPDVTKVVRLNSNERASLHVTGPLKGRLGYEVESSAGEILQGNVEVALSQNETKRIEFPDSVHQQSGIRWVRAKVNDGKKTVIEFAAAFACMEPAQNKRSYEDGDFLFGIAYGPGPDNLSPIAAKKSALIGITMLRDGRQVKGFP